MAVYLFDSPYRAPASRNHNSGPDLTIEWLACERLLSLHRNGRAFNLPLFGELSNSDVQKARMKFTIAGVDEAGRGPLAGPVVTAAVVLSADHIPQSLDDSKKLSARKREELFGELIGQHQIGIAWATPARIDKMNIRRATLWAMAKAVCALPNTPDGILIDGRDVPCGLPSPGGAVIKGDGLSKSIAAASIVAKVIRDRIMNGCGADVPGYGLERHMGYGTKMHRNAIAQFSGSRHHRKSFSPLKDQQK